MTLAELKRRFAVGAVVRRIHNRHGPCDALLRVVKANSTRCVLTDGLDHWHLPWPRATYIRDTDSGVALHAGNPAFEVEYKFL